MSDCKTIVKQFVKQFFKSFGTQFKKISLKKKSVSTKKYFRIGDTHLKSDEEETEVT